MFASVRYSNCSLFVTFHNFSQLSQLFATLHQTCFSASMVGHSCGRAIPCCSLLSHAIPCPCYSRGLDGLPLLLVRYCSLLRRWFATVRYFSCSLFATVRSSQLFATSMFATFRCLFRNFPQLQCSLFASSQLRTAFSQLRTAFATQTDQLPGGRVGMVGQGEQKKTLVLPTKP